MSMDGDTFVSRSNEMQLSFDSSHCGDRVIKFTNSSLETPQRRLMVSVRFEGKVLVGGIQMAKPRRCHAIIGPHVQEEPILLLCEMTKAVVGFVMRKQESEAWQRIPYPGPCAGILLYRLRHGVLQSSQHFVATSNWLSSGRVSQSHLAGILFRRQCKMSANACLQVI